MAQDKIRLLICDDHAMFRAGLRRLLEAERDMEIVGEAENGEGALALTKQLRPDILLLDLAMPGMNGADVLRALGEMKVPTRAVVLTASADDQQLATLLQLGAAGILRKTAATELLYKCVRAVAEGQFWVGRQQISTVMEALFKSAKTETARPFGLTAREIEVVKLLTTGLANKEIASRLHISEETVKRHLTKAFEKTGTSSRVELALLTRDRL